MRTPDDGLDLLAIRTETLFTVSESGRILHENSPDSAIGPRMYIAGCNSGNVFRLQSGLTEKIAGAIAGRAATEPPLNRPDSLPVRLADYQNLLRTETAIEQQVPGVIYRIPYGVRFGRERNLVMSGTLEGDRLIVDLESSDGMPQELRGLGFLASSDLWQPWCIALARGRVASIGMTARLGPDGAESGVVTVPELRGQGFAAAAVAGWASHPALSD